MKIERKFTKAGQDAYADIEFVTTSQKYVTQMEQWFST